MAVGFAALVASIGARADEPADVAGKEYSGYERETLSEVLARRGTKLVVAPEGKTIEGIDIEVLNIIEQRDPAPNFLNWFHANSRDYVISREVLLRPGDDYDQQLVDESQRNLRGLRQLSLVLCVPVQGSRPDAVRLLVIVKDVWSLRLNSDFRFKAGQLEYLFLQPSEENLLGTHRRVAGAFTYKPDTIAVGARFVDPRMASSRYQWSADANIIINQSTGKPEGSYGFVTYGLPLYSLRQKWGWGADIQWRSEVTRRFVGVTLATYDADLTPEDDAIPYVYDTDILKGRIAVTRSFGYEVKHDLQLGMEASRSAYRTGDLAGYNPIAVSQFENEALPVSDTRIGPYLQYHLHMNSFWTLLDVETMGLQEDYRLGPELYLRAYPVIEPLGSTRNLIGGYAAAAYTHLFGDGLARGYAASTVEVDTARENLATVQLQGGLRVVGPRMGIGRFLYDGTVLFRLREYLNSRSYIGGNGRLRGYPSDAFEGKDMVASNLEFRTRPIQLWTVQAGAVAFYDVGDAFDGFARLRPKQGAGFGLRLAFPQLGRIVTRIDWGFPLTPEASTGGIAEGLVVTFRQAFGTPVLNGRTVNLEGK